MAKIKLGLTHLSLLIAGKWKLFSVCGVCVCVCVSFRLSSDLVKMLSVSSRLFSPIRSFLHSIGYRFASVLQCGLAIIGKS